MIGGKRWVLELRLSLPVASEQFAQVRDSAYQGLCFPFKSIYLLFVFLLIMIFVLGKVEEKAAQCVERKFSSSSSRLPVFPILFISCR